MEPPTLGAELRETASTKAATSWFVSRSSSATRSGVGAARARGSARDGRRGNRADLRPGSSDRQLDGEPALELRLVRPDPGHRRPGVAGDHCVDSSGRPRRPAVTDSARSRVPRVSTSAIGSKAGGGAGWPQARCRLRPRSGGHGDGRAAPPRPLRCRSGTACPRTAPARSASYAASRARADRRPEPGDREDPAAVRDEPLAAAARCPRGTRARRAASASSTPVISSRGRPRRDSRRPRARR